MLNFSSHDETEVSVNRDSLLPKQSKAVNDAASNVSQHSMNIIYQRLGFANFLSAVTVQRLQILQTI